MLREIEQRFRDALAGNPSSPSTLLTWTRRAALRRGRSHKRGDDEVVVNVHGRRLRIDVSEITRIARDIDAADLCPRFKPIDQSHIIVSYIPELPDGRPGISSGVERELQHAYGNQGGLHRLEAKDRAFTVYHRDGHRGFPGLPELFKHLQDRGYIGSYQLPLG